MRTTLGRVRAIDVAWNERRWDDYAALLDDSLEAWASGEEEPHGKADRVSRARAFCGAFPDARVHVDQYLALFATHDGVMSGSVARITGTTTSNLSLPGMLASVPAMHRFDISFSLVCEWRDGRVLRQREHVDAALMLRQLSGEPAEHFARWRHA